MEPIIIGIDIGGTHAAAGALTPQGKLLGVEHAEIQAELGFEVGLAVISALIEKAAAAAPGLPRLRRRCGVQ